MSKKEKELFEFIQPPEVENQENLSVDGVSFQDNFRRDHNQDFEKVDPVSMTEPDGTLEIPEILRRFARGERLGGVDYFENSPDEEDPQEFPDLDKLDLAEIQALRLENEQRIKDLQEDLQRLADEKAEKALQDEAYNRLRRGRVGADLLEKQEQELRDREMIREFEELEKNDREKRFEAFKSSYSYPKKTRGGS